MNPRLLSFSILFLSSCGLLGITKSNDTLITDPAERERILASYENKPEVKAKDSLFAMIDAATSELPADLAQTTLVIEIYDLQNFKKAFNTKYGSAGFTDSARYRKLFTKYNKFKYKLLKKPRYKTVYADRNTYEKFSPTTHRYILQWTMRLDPETNRSELHVYSSGSVVPWVATVKFYLYDRQTGAVFREIKDLDVLEK